MKINKLTIFKGVGLFSLILLFYQCQQDDVSVNTDNCFIKEFIQSPYFVEDSITKFSIDTFTHIIENGIITQRIRNNKLFEEFQYNENNSLTAIKRIVQGNWFVSDSFFYEDEKLIKTLSYSLDGEITNEQYLYWEGEKLKSGYAITFQKVNGEIERIDFKFDYQYANENIAEIIQTYYLHSGDTLATRITFQFDSNENYVKYLTFVPVDNIIDFSLSNAPYWYSANNVTLETKHTIDNHWISEKSHSHIWGNGKIIEFIATSHTNTSTDSLIRPVKINYECF
ncbi:MAG: hypothetical protein IPN76_09055 [Saprospiraceae bacterium]|nr:hypothetical protein [Saprospiraceae bacterium]